MTDQNTSEATEEKIIVEVEKRKGNTAAYNRQYYDEKKQTINARRRKLYKNNLDVRELAKNRRSAQYQEEKKQRTKARRIRRNATGAKPGRSVRIQIAPGRVESTTWFTIGQFALRCEISTATVRKWERSGILPQPTFFTGGGQRRYTLHQCEAVQGAIAEHRAICAQRTDARWRVSEEFKESIRAALAKLTNGVLLGDDDNEDFDDWFDDDE